MINKNIITNEKEIITHKKSLERFNVSIDEHP